MKYFNGEKSTIVEPVVIKVNMFPSFQLYAIIKNLNQVRAIRVIKFSHVAHFLINQ